jgi:DNA-binding transcriptional LysR family regulator
MNLQRLDLNLLRALDTLLTECNITRASKPLHLSPSAVSGALARLREFFGNELLSPLGRNMVLTPLAECLREPVRDCLLQIQATIEIRPTFDPATASRVLKLLGFRGGSWGRHRVQSTGRNPWIASCFATFRCSTAAGRHALSPTCW